MEHLPRHYTLTEMADMVGIAKPILYRLARDGKLEAVKVGHLWYTTIEAVERILRPTKNVPPLDF